MKWINRTQHLAAASKPRNPVAPAASARSAGRHQRGSTALRQRSRMSLRHELDALQTQGP
jgi:hypothetical protein